jgi:hypothetical protein
MSMVPPLAINRVIAVYDFEGGGFVALVSGGSVPTEKMHDVIEQQIALKRGELARLAQAKATAAEPAQEPSSPAPDRPTTG